MVSPAFIITSLIVVLIPGTGVIYTVSTGITGSRRSTIAAAVGCTLGIIPHLTAGILGISALLHTGALIFRVVKYIGAAYLLYIGFGLLTSRNQIRFNDGGKREQDLKVIGKGILLNILNPKLTLFFLSFLPQFISDPGSHYLSQMVFLSSLFMGITLAIFLLYGMLANYFKQLFISSPGITKRIQKGFGAILIGFAVKLALTEE